MVNLLQIFGLFFKTSLADHRLVSHKPGPVVQSLLHTARLIKHLHCVVMVDTGRQLNPDFLLSHSLQQCRLYAISQRKFEDLLVANIVVSLCIVLKHGRVRRHNLKVMCLRLLRLLL